MIPVRTIRNISFLALLISAASVTAPNVVAQKTPAVFTRADTLRGSNTPQRSWWDVTFYDLNVSVSPNDSSLKGYNAITYKVLKASQEMQIDLMTPLVIDSIVQKGKVLSFKRDGNAFFVTMVEPQQVGKHNTVTVYYSGKPRVAKNAPWDGGVVWSRDSAGNMWIATACQGVGASIWWPNKDLQLDEPDSQRIAVTVPDPLVNVSNGRLRSTTRHDNGTSTYEWFVSNPINNYDVALNVGMYAHYTEEFAGEKGKLSLDFWPLAENLEKAKAQFEQAKPMLACFERWFGPYPWYKDGYKLVEAPFLGMEHQSAVAYGNEYRNGYRGRDLSETGWGLKWDFILVHESGHEWFGNNITTQDIADMWVHESFTNYSEGLYTECQFGKDAGAAYIIGLRKRVQNDKPIVAPYGVNQEGSGDMYYKGANMLHTMRQIVNNDETWRSMLRGLGETFGHKTVTGRQVQEYINQKLAVNFDKVFEQYLTTTKIPLLEWKLVDTTLSYRWADVVSGFDMPVSVTLARDVYTIIQPTESWQTATVRLDAASEFQVDKNFYVRNRKVE